MYDSIGNPVNSGSSGNGGSSNTPSNPINSGSSGSGATSGMYKSSPTMGGGSNVSMTTLEPPSDIFSFTGESGNGATSGMYKSSPTMGGGSNVLMTTSEPPSDIFSFMGESGNGATSGMYKSSPTMGGGSNVSMTTSEPPSDIFSFTGESGNGATSGMYKSSPTMGGRSNVSMTTSEPPSDIFSFTGEPGKVPIDGGYNSFSVGGTTTNIFGAKKTEAEFNYSDSNVKTTTVENPMNGNAKTLIVKTDKDGTETEILIESKANGSSVTRTKEKTTDGIETKIVEKVNSDGSARSKTIVKDEDYVHITKSTEDSNGNTFEKEITRNKPFKLFKETGSDITDYNENNNKPTANTVYDANTTSNENNSSRLKSDLGRKLNTAYVRVEQDENGHSYYVGSTTSTNFPKVEENIKNIYNEILASNCLNVAVNEMESTANFPALLPSTLASMQNTNINYLSKLASECNSIKDAAQLVSDMDAELALQAQNLEGFGFGFGFGDTSNVQLSDVNASFSELAAANVFNDLWMDNLDGSRPMSLSLSDLNAYRNSSINELMTDNEDCARLNDSLESFENSISATGELKGLGWNSVKYRLGMYDNILQNRIAGNSLIMDAINAAADLVSNYMSPYEYLDTSKIPEIVSAINACKEAIASLTTMINATHMECSYNIESKTYSEHCVEVHDYSADARAGFAEQIEQLNAQIEELSQELAKLVGLPEIEAQASKIMNEAYSEYNNIYGNSVRDLAPSPSPIAE